MNRWVRHTQLAQLEQCFWGSANHCHDFFLLFHMVQLDGMDPIGIDDNATALFFKLVDFNPKARRADLETLKDCILECITEQVKSPTADYSKKLEKFFESRKIGDGWLHLDRIFSHMTGKTLSGVVDAPGIMYRPEDAGLNGQDLFSVTMKVNQMADNSIRFHEIRWAAIASDLDGILLLAKEAVNNHHLAFSSSWNLNNSSSNGKIIENQPEQWSPCDLDIKKNGNRLMALKVNKAESDDGYDIDWARANLIRPSLDVIESIGRVTTPRVVNLLKGRYLQEALGL
jgi:hypothetical protein